MIFCIPGVMGRPVDKSVYKDLTKAEQNVPQRDIRCG